MMKIKKVAEKWEIWDKEEEAAGSEKEVKKLVPKQLYKQIKVFGKKASKRMPTRKMQDYIIELKERFSPRKEKIYLLSREERGSKRVHSGGNKKEIYSTIKVTTNSTSILCKKKE